LVHLADGRGREGLVVPGDLDTQRPTAFYAAMVAVASLGVTVGKRGRRVIELVMGMALGLTIADLLVLVIGAGTVPIVVVVVPTMSAAIFFVGKPLLVIQGAISAMLVVALQPPGTELSSDRFFDQAYERWVAETWTSFNPNICP
jgi:uncharacterized membrane protein YgaE (UPF0421/DUF939 family)